MASFYLNQEGNIELVEVCLLLDAENLRVRKIIIIKTMKMNG